MNLEQVKKEILQNPILSRLSNLAKEKNAPLFLVGGYIRDLFLKTYCPAYRHTGKDYDFTLPKEAAPFMSEMEETLGFRFFKVGKEAMETVTHRIVKKDMSFDLTFFQGPSIDDDLKRRDFTINAVAFSLRDGTFHWVEGALEDLENRVIRAVSWRSIDQDPLRMFRAIRYLCTLDRFLLDEELKKDISTKKIQIVRLPGERIKMELDQIFLSPQPDVGMKYLFELSLLLTLLPDLKGLQNLGQSEHHHLDVLSHTLLMIGKIPWTIGWVALRGRRIVLMQEDLLSLSYAALLHDLGKQDTYSKDEKRRVHFYHHESFSCRRADAIMERLRFSNPMRHKILHLIKNHMRILNLSRETKGNALKRLINQIGDETPLLVLHTLADKEASRGILSIQIDEVVEENSLRILDLFEEKEIVHPSSLITGHDVISLGYTPGPKVGQILDFIRQKQIEGEIRTREEALNVLKETFQQNEDNG